ncbi:MAG: hypothetical protein KGJ98_10295 [Chloroflexota bacterium]|nr:hypothetical protein [Chloroflexota bacterium]MDE3102615.1 hypothetical protein [Chloroflexota bacterium]
MRDLLDRPLATALAALLFGCAVVAVQLAREGDVSAFVRAAPPWVDPASAPSGLRVGTAGYDGQFYYALALDPLTDRRTEHGVTFDRPAYRQQRIVYPLLGWAVSLGQAGRVPWSLVLVNLVGLFAIGLIGAQLALGARRHALWGLLFPLYPGFVITVTSDLTEIVAAVFVLAALLWLRGQRTLRAAGALSLAVLSRETTVLLAATAGLGALVASWRQPRRWAPLLLPGMALIVWQIFLASRWHETATAEGTTALSPPLLGLLVAVWSDPQRFAPARLAVWAGILAFVMAMVVVGARSLGSSIPRYERWAWSVYLALAALLEANIWATGGVLRALTELAMLTALFALTASRSLRTALLALEIALSGVLVATGLRI